MVLSTFDKGIIGLGLTQMDDHILPFGKWFVETYNVASFMVQNISKHRLAYCLGLPSPQRKHPVAGNGLHLLENVQTLEALTKLNDKQKSYTMTSVVAISLSEFASKTDEIFRCKKHTIL